MGAAMLAALAVYCMKAVAANSQLSPPAAGELLCGRPPPPTSKCTVAEYHKDAVQALQQQIEASDSWGSVPRNFETCSFCRCKASAGAARVI
jgi:hypothetical protein